MPVLQFPFGMPVKERVPWIQAARRAYVLGAYPSALHVYWRPPKPYRPIQAIAVDNEPDFFWNGGNEEAITAEWQKEIGFSEQWGEVFCAGKLNGSSGLWVDENILNPFHLARNENVWISDCLTTYRSSTGVKARLEDTYLPFAQKANLPVPLLGEHPGEEEIVREALSQQKNRLRSELYAAKPEMVITLGNAALRVMRELVDFATAPAKLAASMEVYGKPIAIQIEGKLRAVWYPLAHPAAPKVYQQAHICWIEQLTV